MLAEDTLEWERFRGDDVNLEISSPERGRGLEPDEAAADHHGALGALRGVDDRAAVGERAERVYVRAIGARHVQADGLRAGREQQRVVLERLAAVHLELLVLRVDPRGAAADDVDLVLGVEVVGAKRDPFLGRVAREVVLGQVGPVVRRSVVLVDDGEPSLVARATKHLGGRGAGGAPADDHDGSGSGRPVEGDGIGGAQRIALALSRDEDFLIAPFHGPARDGRQRRRAKRFARAQVEAGVVPRTAHLVAVDESLGERAAVVRAGRADREEIVAAADEEHSLAVGVTEQGSPSRTVLASTPAPKSGPISFACSAMVVSFR